MSKWIILIGAVLALVSLWLGFSLSNTKHMYEEAARQLREEQTKSRVLTEALVAVQESNEREQSRLDRAIRNIEAIRREPVTTGCGPSVHGAIERLRE